MKIAVTGELATVSDSEWLPLGGLPFQQEGFGEPAFTANLEGSKVFVPKSIRCLGLRLSPDFQLVQIFDSDLPIVQTVEEVLAKSSWKILPLNLGHHSPKVIRASS